MVLEKVKGVLVYRNRVDSVKSAFGAFRSESAVDAVLGLGTRFGRNNRTLLHNITGGLRSR